MSSLRSGCHFPSAGGCAPVRRVGQRTLQETWVISPALHRADNGEALKRIVDKRSAQAWIAHGSGLGNENDVVQMRNAGFQQGRLPSDLIAFAGPAGALPGDLQQDFAEIREHRSTLLLAGVKREHHLGGPALKRQRLRNEMARRRQSVRFRFRVDGYGRAEVVGCQAQQVGAGITVIRRRCSVHRQKSQGFPDRKSTSAVDGGQTLREWHKWQSADFPGVRSGASGMHAWGRLVWHRVLGSGRH